MEATKISDFMSHWAINQIIVHHVFGWKKLVLHIMLIKIWCSYKLAQVDSQQVGNNRHVSELHFSEARGHC